MNSRISRIAIGVGALTFMFGGLTARQALAVATVDRDINHYVLFAFEELDWKGGNAAGTGFITGGNVGVNRVDLSHGDSTARANVGENGRFIMSDNTQVTADSLRLGVEASVWNAFTNDEVGAFDGTIRDAGNPASLAFAAPILASEPGLPFTPGRAITDGAADQTVAKNGALALAAGNYRDIEVKDGATLTLGDGEYNIRNFKTGQNTKIIVTDLTVLNIDGEFILNNGTEFGAGTTGKAKVFVGSDGVSSNDRTINLSADVFAAGQFFAPNGKMNFGRSADGFGRFWAETITSDFNVNLTYINPNDPGTPQNPTPTPEPLTAATGLLAIMATGLAASRRRRD